MTKLLETVESLLIVAWNGLNGSGPSKHPESKPASIGTTEGGEAFDFDSDDRAKTMYLLGATGSGKTTLFLHLIEGRLRSETTLVVIDLRGDLVLAVLALCDRLGVDPARVTLIDLREKQRPQAFNPLAGTGEAYIRALHVLSVLADSAASWGVQLEETLRNALLVLAESGQPLIMLEQFFFDSSFRMSCLSTVRDASLAAFWERYGAMSTDRQQSWATPVLNKATSLLAVPTLRQILGGRDPVDLKKLLDTKGRVLLVSLAGDELFRSAEMMGSLVISSVTREIMARVNVPEGERNPVAMYCDEFENMASEAFESLVAESRRFHCSFTAGHQTASQLPPRLRSVIRNNAGVQVFFQLGSDDARVAAAELPKEFTALDLRAQSVGEAIVMKRNGTAVRVQFNPPSKAWPLRSTMAFRDQVLSRITEVASAAGADLEVETKAGPDLEDWL